MGINERADSRFRRRCLSVLAKTRIIARKIRVFGIPQTPASGVPIVDD
jgi:hypothetical protein